VKSLKLQARQDHIEKIAKTSEPVRAIAELIWNGLDADADKIDVVFTKNALGGVEYIEVIDNGDGFNLKTLLTDFQGLGGSWKARALKTSKGRALHGREGKGRLKFYSLADRCKWTTVYDEDGARYELVAIVRSTSLENVDYDDPVSAQEKATGTHVLIGPLVANQDYLASQEAFAKLSEIFAPFLKRNPAISVSYNQQRINLAAAIERTYPFEITDVVDEAMKPIKCSGEIIEWRMTNERRQWHLCSTGGGEIGSIPVGIRAPGFSFSGYLFHEYFQELQDKNLLGMDDLADPTYAKIIEAAKDKAREYFAERNRERSGTIIAGLKAEGVYPYEGEPTGAAEKIERGVFDAAAIAVTAYSKRFHEADRDVRQLSLSLIREAVRQNPASLTDILTKIIRLPKEEQDDFASLLRGADLGAIVASTKLVADRVTTLDVIRRLVFDDAQKKKTLERGQLDVVVGENTWLFGEAFNLSMAETGLTKAINAVCSHAGQPAKTKGAKLADGKSGRLDIVLGRRVPLSDANRHEYLIVELKRPEPAVSYSELSQVYKYADALMARDEFKRLDATWNFWLVCNAYDDSLQHQLRQKDAPLGRALNGERHSVWVKSWAELLSECDARLDFVQQHLDYRVQEGDVEERIAALTGKLTGSKASEEKQARGK
jgi:hypothetical protein